MVAVVCSLLTDLQTQESRATCFSYPASGGGCLLSIQQICIKHLFCFRSMTHGGDKGKCETQTLPISTYSLGHSHFHGGHCV